MDINENDNINNDLKPKQNTSSLFLVRVTVCVVILCTVIFIKFNNISLFENFKTWYNNNFLEEVYSASQIKEIIINFFASAWQKVNGILEKVGTIKV